MTSAVRAELTTARASPSRLGMVGIPAVLGTLAAVVFVLLEGHTHVVPGQVPPSHWFGLLGPVSASRRAVDSLAAWAAILTLGGCWLVLVRRVRAGLLPLRPLAWTGAAWATPFVLGPPLTSLDVYSYVAHGFLSKSGHSPYSFAPADLAPGPVLNAVDPRWHHVFSPYGPIATFNEHLAASVGGSALGTLEVLRLLAAAATAVSIALAVAMTRPDLRPRTMVLLGLNPLLLTTTFSAAHLEATMLVALLAAFFAARRGHPVLAVVLAVVAGLIKAPALAAVPFLIVENWRTDRRALVVVRDIAVAAVTAVIGGLLVPNGWGWTGPVLHTPAIGREWWTPSTLLAELGYGIGRLVGLPVHLAGLLGVTRSIGLAVSALLLLELLRRRGDPALSLGIGLTALGVLGFVLYPWYLLWGWPLLVIAGSRRTAYVSSLAAAAFTLANLWPQRREAAALPEAIDAHRLVTVLVLLVIGIAGAGGRWRTWHASRNQNRPRPLST
ncbi:MAG: polyprenol phosphomannose-dependent alpha 1,6 mannosyltransferase MptB [Catenulispora sp.]